EDDRRARPAGAQPDGGHTLREHALAQALAPSPNPRPAARGLGFDGEAVRRDGVDGDPGARRGRDPERARRVRGDERGLVGAGIVAAPELPGAGGAAGRAPADPRSGEPPRARGRTRLEEPSAVGVRWVGRAARVAGSSFDLAALPLALGAQRLELPPRPRP